MTKIAYKQVAYVDVTVTNEDLNGFIRPLFHHALSCNLTAYIDHDKDSVIIRFPNQEQADAWVDKLNLERA